MFELPNHFLLKSKIFHLKYELIIFIVKVVIDKMIRRPGLRGIVPNFSTPFRIPEMFRIL